MRHQEGGFRESFQTNQRGGVFHFGQDRDICTCSCKECPVPWHQGCWGGRSCSHLLQASTSRVTAAGSFLLVAQAISSIFLSFTTIPWFPRPPGAAPSERDLMLNWSAVIFILHRGVREFSASLCLGNPYTPALKPHPVDFPYCAALGPASHGGSVCLSGCSMRIIHTWCLVSKQEQYGSGSCKNFC